MCHQCGNETKKVDEVNGGLEAHFSAVKIRTFRTLYELTPKEEPSSIHICRYGLACV